MVESQARGYLHSYPGSDSKGGNTIYTKFRDLLKGRPFDMTWLERLSDILIYRMSLMRLATDFKDFLKLRFPDCAMYDVEAWKTRYYLEARQQDEVGQIANEKTRKFREITKLIVREPRIFDGCLMTEQGLTYVKPREYLSIALVESEMSLTQVETELNKCQACKSWIPSLLMRQPIDEYLVTQARVARLSTKVKEDRTVHQILTSMFEKLEPFGKRLRSLSPQKGGKGKERAQEEW
jgi:hypothetical protein